MYVLDFVFKEALNINYVLTDDVSVLNDNELVVIYGNDKYDNFVTIPNANLLFEERIGHHEPKVGEWEKTPTIFDAEKENCSLPFDILSAIFYLISRYEEYYPIKLDKYDRFPPENSILYQNNWLKRPLVDEWILLFKNLLEKKFHVALPVTDYIFQPTYDIDIAFSMLHKGLYRTFGRMLEIILKLDFSALLQQIEILTKHIEDPYNSFGKILGYSNFGKRKPIFFILAALKTTRYDKNIHPLHWAMKEIILEMKKNGAVGIHPSYYSDNEETLVKEKKVLESIIGSSIQISRQHYIKLKIPHTYRRLALRGIKEDYSMGYGSILGFRAGTGRAFFWYDLESEAVSKLRIFPFCFMDSTAKFEEHLTVEQAFNQLYEFQTILHKCGSTLTTVFHNFSLGTAKEWEGWGKEYERFIDKEQHKK